MPTVTVNGIEQHYELLGAGPPLVLLHGFTGSSADFRHLYDLEALARDYQLIIPDQRGHGRSTNPGLEITHRQCALDLAALLDHLGIGRFNAVGISMGGNTMLHFATREPERVEAMVLSGSPPYFTAQTRAVMATHPQGGVFKDNYDDMAFTPPKLGLIQARTLLVNGDRDPFYPVELFFDMYRAIPKSSLWIIPGGGHAPVFAGARPEFERISLAFLRGAWPAV